MPNLSPEQLELNHALVNNNYNKLDNDKFYAKEYGVVRAYYNPNSCAGGSIVYDELHYTDIISADTTAANDEEFYDALYEPAKQTMCDINTEEFFESAQEIIHRDSFCNGMTNKTRKILVAFAKDIERRANCTICTQTNVHISESTTTSDNRHPFVDLRVDMNSGDPSLDIQYGLLDTGTDNDKFWTESIPMNFCFNCGKRL